jgi:hypothetical protein
VKEIVQISKMITVFESVPKRDRALAMLDAQS